MSGFSAVDEIYIRYANQFIKTGNKKLAAISAGVDAELVDDFISTADDHPEVLALIAEDLNSFPDFDNIDDVKKHVLSGLWKEAKYRGPGANQGARIAAYKAVGELVGLAPPQKAGGSTDNGGLLLVPVSDPKDWEEQAKISQKALLESARD